MNWASEHTSDSQHSVTQWWTGHQNIPPTPSIVWPNWNTPPTPSTAAQWRNQHVNVPFVFVFCSDRSLWSTTNTTSWPTVSQTWPPPCAFPTKPWPVSAHPLRLRSLSLAAVDFVKLEQSVSGFGGWLGEGGAGEGGPFENPASLTPWWKFGSTCGGTAPQRYPFLLACAVFLCVQWYGCQPRGLCSCVCRCWYMWFSHRCVCLRMCVRVCVCVCACVSWGWGWGLGGMELRVGSNIMIHFLYILLLPYGTCTCVLYIVVIIICIMFVKPRKCWRML